MRRFRNVALALLLLGAHEAEAQTTVVFGPVYLEGKDEYGPDPGFGLSNNDWSGAKDGQGLALSVRHDWGRVYVVANGEWLDIRHRSQRIRPICAVFPNTPVPRPPYPACARATATFNFDDEYRAVQVAIGYRHPFAERWAVWGQLGHSYQRWSSSGGTVQLRVGGLIADLNDIRHSESTWTAAAGLSRRTERLSIELGVAYQPEGYFPSTRLLLAFEPQGSSSLLEGIARADWYFTQRWFARLEYRPSRQRQYLHAGLGIAF